MAVKRNEDGTVTTTFADGSSKTQSADGRTLVSSTPATGTGNSSSSTSGSSSGSSGGGNAYGNRETAYTFKDPATGQTRTIYSNYTRYEDAAKAAGLSGWQLANSTTYGTGSDGRGNPYASGQQTGGYYDEAIRRLTAAAGGGDLGSDFPEWDYLGGAPLYQAPGQYVSPYSGQIDKLLNAILRREDFSYDHADDPLYQQYAKTYQREGDRATQNAIAEAAAMTGGASLILCRDRRGPGGELLRIPVIR